MQTRQCIVNANFAKNGESSKAAALRSQASASSTKQTTISEWSVVEVPTIPLDSEPPVNALLHQTRKKRKKDQLEHEQSSKGEGKDKGKQKATSTASSERESPVFSEPPSVTEFRTQKDTRRLPSLAEFKAQKADQLAIDIKNKQEEVKAATTAGKVRTSLQSKSTADQYLYYERHWVEFIDRHKYPSYNVVVDVVTRYFLGLISEDNPYLVRSKRGSKPKNTADDEVMVLPSPNTMDMHIKALVNLYHQQCADVENHAMTLQTVPNPRSYLNRLLDAYTMRFNLTKRSKDIGTVSLVETNSAGILRQMMKACWVRNFKSLGAMKRRKLNGLRDRLDICWLQFMMCRGENTRKARLPDLFPHDVTEPNGKGQFTLGVVLLMLQGKTNKDGRQNYGVVVRNKDVQICPVGALGFYFFELWKHEQRPNLDDPSWTSFHLLVGNDPMEEISDNTQYQAHRSVMDSVNIKDRKKVTHRSRVLEAQYAQSCGASVESIVQHGNWAINRLATHYLSRVDSTVALHMAGFNPVQERLWLPRNTVIPPVELQRQVFPFIEEQFPDDPDWAPCIENIMLDRDIFHGRSILQSQASQAPHITDNENGGQSDSNKSNGNSLPNEENEDDIPKRRHMILLAHLRKVILQDAVAVMELGANDRVCPYGEHHIFQEPVFKTQQFYDFRNRLLNEMVTANSPLCDSLAANAPSIHQGFQDVKAQQNETANRLQQIAAELSEIKRGKERSDQWLQSMDTAIRCLDTSIKELKDKSIRKDQSALRMISKLMFETGRLFSSQGQPILTEEIPRLVEDQHESRDRPSVLDHLRPLQEPTPQSHTPQQSRAQENLDTEGINLNELMGRVARMASEEQRRGGKGRDKPEEMPEIAMLPRNTQLDILWKEWFYGSDNKPSIYEMDAWYATKWRRAQSVQQTNANAVLHLFKKHVIYSVLEAIPPGMSLKEGVAAALAIVNQRISCNGSVNQYFQTLPKGESKQKKKYNNNRDSIVVNGK